MAQGSQTPTGCVTLRFRREDRPRRSRSRPFAFPAALTTLSCRHQNPSPYPKTSRLASKDAYERR
jgi:hypothetical protein